MRSTLGLVLLLLLFLWNVKGEVTEAPIIGIDLGTTFSVVGVFENGKVDILANDQGHRITPSIVSFYQHDIKERLVGEGARNRLELYPESTVYTIKRLIGRPFNDASVQKDIKTLPFKLVEKNNLPHVAVPIYESDPLTKQDRRILHQFSTEEISAMILSKMKSIAQNHFSSASKSIKKAVITVPAYFNDQQRQATKDAGVIAGLEVVRIINEPTAAALAYGLDEKIAAANEKKKGSGNVVVFDLGGGTFDVSILTIVDGFFEVISTKGDTHLGGEDFDLSLVAHMVKILNKKYTKQLKGKSILSDKRAYAKLKRECESVKKMLSSSHEARLEIESLLPGIDVSEKVSRATFENLNMPYFKKTITTLSEVLKDAQLEKAQIQDVVMVGGSSRIPKIQELVKEFFGGKDLCISINPDEAIAFGAAIQGAIISKDPTLKQSSKILLVDVCPLSLGIETVGGIMSSVIKRNSPIPTRKSQVFTTFVDLQDQVDIEIFQGERSLTKDNNFLGRFELTGIRPQKKGVPEITVTFELDENSILHVSAKDESSKAAKGITIKAQKTSLSKEQVDRLVQEAEEASEKDRVSRDKIDARNSLEASIAEYRNLLDDANSGSSLAEMDPSSKKRITQSFETAAIAEVEEQLKILDSVVRPVIVQFETDQEEKREKDLKEKREKKETPKKDSEL